jgi:hypothetical protein
VPTRFEPEADESARAGRGLGWPRSAIERCEQVADRAPRLERMSESELGMHLVGDHLRVDELGPAVFPTLD